MPLLKVLLVAEDVTLAQVVRLAALGKALLDQAGDEYEVHFASGSFDPLVFDACQFTKHELFTAPKAQIFRAMDKGKRLYERETLFQYLRADIELIERVQPDVVVGDFRLSLSTAAELCGVKCGTLINAYWSPFYERPAWPVPDHPIVRWLGESLTAQYFPRAIPKVFSHFAAPLDAVRKKHGLKPLGSLLEMLTHGSATLYADDPALFPMRNLPGSHLFLGPVPWSPACEVPKRLLDRDPSSRPLVYVTLGSSGRLDALTAVIDALGSRDIDVALATAGRLNLDGLPSNIQAYPFLPGEWMSEHAQIVICNGGSSTGYQAVSAGTPVLALPSNFDQFLATQVLVAQGAALEIPARLVTAAKVSHALDQLLGTPSFTDAARRLADSAAQQDSHAQFKRWLKASTLP